MADRDDGQLVARWRAHARGLAGRAVDGEVGDATVRDAPLLHDLVVDALGLQILEGELDGLSKAGVLAALWHGDAVRRGAVDLACDFELAVGLLAGVRVDRGVGE